jgi:hypothetical protein
MVCLFFVFLHAFVAYGIEPNAVEHADYSFDSEKAFSLKRFPDKDGSWNMIPTVYVCKDTPISASRVRSAMRVWQRLGYEMIGPIMNSKISACINRDYSRGNIIIQLRGQSFKEENLAMTRTYRMTKTREIISARIEIQAFAPKKERVIEHEFGHAFGWHHFNRRYHIMNSVHSLGGWDTYGLRSPND